MAAENKIEISIQTLVDGLADVRRLVDDLGLLQPAGTEAARALNAAGGAADQMAEDADQAAEEMILLERQLRGMDDAGRNASGSLGGTRDVLDGMGGPIQALGDLLGLTSQNMEHMGQSANTAAQSVGDSNVSIEGMAAVSDIATTGLTRLTGALAGFFVLDRIIGLIDSALSLLRGNVQAVLDIGAAFETLQASLKTVSGSSEQAEKDLEWIRDFTAKTPYELLEVGNSFKLMGAYGLDARKDLQLLGDTASSMGKSLDEAVQMWADAMGLQFERLLEFGVRATQEGGKVQLYFTENGQQIVKETSKNSEAVGAALREIFSRYSGGMEEQAKTWNGILSNMADSWTGFQKQIADAGSFNLAKDILKSILDAANELAANGTLQYWAENLSEVFENSFGGLDKDKETIGQFFSAINEGGLLLAETGLPTVKFFVEELRQLLVLMGKDPNLTAADKVREKIQGVKEEINSLQEGIEKSKTGTWFEKLFYGSEYVDIANQRIKDLEAQLLKYQTQEDKLSNSTDKSVGHFRQLENASVDMNEVLDRVNRTSGDTGIHLGAAGDQAKRSAEILKQMAEESKKAEDALKRLGVDPTQFDFGNVVKDLELVAKASGTSSDAFKQAFDNAIQMASSEKDIQLLSEQVTKFEKSGLNAGEAYVALNQRMGEIQVANMGFKEGVNDTADALNKTAEAAENAKEKITGVGDGGSYWKDIPEDLSKAKEAADDLGASFTVLTGTAQDTFTEITGRTREATLGLSDLFAGAKLDQEVYWEAVKTGLLEFTQTYNGAYVNIEGTIDNLNAKYGDSLAVLGEYFDGTRGISEQSLVEVGKLISELTLLDDVKLGELRQEFDSLRQEVISLWDEYHGIVLDLEGELAGLRGEDLLNQWLTYYEKRNSLEAELAATEDTLAKEQLQRALEYQDEIWAARSAKIRESLTEEQIAAQEAKIAKIRTDEEVFEKRKQTQLQETDFYTRMLELQRGLLSPTIPSLPSVPGVPIRHSGGPSIGIPLGNNELLAKLLEGEYVIRPEAVARFGQGFFDSLNALTLPKFHEGGLVEGLVKDAFSKINSQDYTASDLAGAIENLISAFRETGLEYFIPEAEAKLEQARGGDKTSYDWLKQTLNGVQIKSKTLEINQALEFIAKDYPAYAEELKKTLRETTSGIEGSTSVGYDELGNAAIRTQIADSGSVLKKLDGLLDQIREQAKALGMAPTFHTGGLAGNELLAVLKRGEFVIREESVSKYGMDLLRRINEGTYTPRFHTGGLVASMPKPLTGAVSNRTTNQTNNLNISMTVPEVSERQVREQVIPVIEAVYKRRN